MSFLDLEQLEKLMEKERCELNRMATLHGLKDERVLVKSSRLDRIMDKYLHTKRAINGDNQAHP
nr:aspartyl-phosphate phosphatase Spo0E family protein [Paenibacillus terrae]